MSRDLDDENYYHSKGSDKIPLKWTAPEVSDIASDGVCVCVCVCEVHYRRQHNLQCCYRPLNSMTSGCYLYQIANTKY